MPKSKVNLFLPHRCLIHIKILEQELVFNSSKDITYIPLLKTALTITNMEELHNTVASFKDTRQLEVA
jgi:hypothetical protein